jgi:hypothetical protein
LKMFPSEDIFVCQQKRDEQPVSWYVSSRVWIERTVPTSFSKTVELQKHCDVLNGRVERRKRRSFRPWQQFTRRESINQSCCS